MARSIYALCSTARRCISRRWAFVGLALGAGACVLSTGVHISGAVPAEARARDAWGNLPLSFEPNRGQARPDVEFLSRGNGYALYLTSTGADLVLRTPGAPHPGTVVRMQVVGARPGARARGVQELPGRSSYFVGKDPRKWRTDVPTYARVEYRDVYPGIDLVYYGTQRRLLEYDFVVAPGADPTTISLRFHGVDTATIDADGSLALQGTAGGIRLHKPVAYQHVDGARKDVPAAYVLADDGRIGFQVAAYDTAAPLIIDPIVAAYATFLGGNSIDQGFGIAVDAAGNAYVTGNTFSTDFPPTPGSVQPAIVSQNDVFVTKLNASGTALVYSTFLGGNGDDAGRGIAVDSAGNAIVTGFTLSPDFPTQGAFQLALGGLTDVFVAKLNPTGSVLVYSTYLGGTGDDIGLGVAVDGSGSAYVTGGTRPTILTGDYPTTSGAFQTTAGGGSCGPGGSINCRDAFVTKLDPTGAVVYSTLVGGDGDDAGNGIAVDSAGNAAVTGFTQSANFPTTTDAFQSTLSGTTDAFVTKLNAAGSAPLLYSSYLGGSGEDFGNAIALDGAGTAHLTGTTASANFPTVGGPGFSGQGEAFATKLALTANASPAYSRSLLSLDVGAAIAVDGTGNALIAGTELLCSVTGITGCTSFNNDAFVVKLDPAAAVVATIFLGGSGDDTGQAIALDSAGNPFLTGDTTSTDFPTTPSAFQTLNQGTPDAFVVRLQDVAATPGSVGGTGSGCFIATAAFGSPLVREVQVLRDFRDRRLLTNAAGRVLVRAYYWMSPPLARAIAASDVLRAATRGTLRPLIWAARLTLVRPAQAWMLAAGSLAVGVLVPLLLFPLRRASKRVLVFALVLLCATAGGALVTLDRTERGSPISEPSTYPVAGPREPRPTLRPSGPSPATTTAHGQVRIREIGPGRYEIRGAPVVLADLALTATPLPSFGTGLHVLISSVAGDGVLTSEGLTVTDPKLSAEAGIQVGDTIRSINGFPVRQAHVALLAMQRDPDRGTVELLIDRQGMRLTQVYVMR